MVCVRLIGVPIEPMLPHASGALVFFESFLFESSLMTHYRLN
jgi:hypothetical protein